MSRWKPFYFSIYSCQATWPIRTCLNCSLQTSVAYQVAYSWLEKTPVCKYLKFSNVFQGKNFCLSIPLCKMFHWSSYHFSILIGASSLAYSFTRITYSIVLWAINNWFCGCPVLIIAKNTSICNYHRNSFC